MASARTPCSWVRCRALLPSLTARARKEFERLGNHYRREGRLWLNFKIVEVAKKSSNNQEKIRNTPGTIVPLHGTINKNVNSYSQWLQFA